MSDAEIDRGAQGPTHRLDAAAMTHDPGQAAGLRPAAVPVHDDRDMAWRLGLDRR
ncbi:MAG: hypothetical protein WDN69_33550 [Aliidongia sp.]